MSKLKMPQKKKLRIGSNTIMLLITIALFIALYGAGCIMYANKDFGRLQNFFNVLINNAGGALQIPRGEFEDMPLDYWDSQIALKLNACA